MKEYLAFDIGGTKCAVLRGNELGEVTAREVFPTDHAAGCEAMLQRLFEAAERLRTEAVCAIGVSCGGPLDSRTGMILSPPNLPGWDEVAIVERLERRFGLPTLLQNDANACALAEWRFGAGRGSENMIFLTFGTGFGAGLILGGRLYEGRSGSAGEVGHIRLEATGPVGYGKAGSMEGFCSGGGVAQLGQMAAREQLQRGTPAAYCPNYEALSDITARSLAEAARGGDETALAVWRQVGHYLGRGLAILMDLFDPDCIVIGSIYARSGDLMEAEMQAVLRRETLPNTHCPVRPAELGERIGDVGALCVAMQAAEK